MKIRLNFLSFLTWRKTIFLFSTYEYENLHNIFSFWFCCWGIGEVVEGAATAEVVLRKMEQYDVRMPLFRSVAMVLNGSLSCEEGMKLATEKPTIGVSEMNMKWYIWYWIQKAGLGMYDMGWTIVFHSFESFFKVKICHNIAQVFFQSIALACFPVA